LDGLAVTKSFYLEYIQGPQKADKLLDVVVLLNKEDELSGRSEFKAFYTYEGKVYIIIRGVDLILHQARIANAAENAEYQAVLKKAAKTNLTSSESPPIAHESIRPLEQQGIQRNESVQPLQQVPPVPPKNPRKKIDSIQEFPNQPGLSVEVQRMKKEIDQYKTRSWLLRTLWLSEPQVPDISLWTQKARQEYNQAETRYNASWFKWLPFFGPKKPKKIDYCC
jgi:hypothetical protein